MKRFFVLIFVTVNMIFSSENDNEFFYRRLLERAPQTVGLKKFPKINGQYYHGDCSGFIAFLFHLAGLNLKKLYGIGDNGVTAIWNGLSQNGFILKDNRLKEGDIVFFDNTYDMNKNTKWDDKLSHIGIVESIDKFQTVTYLHYGSKGVMRAKMNVSHPHVFTTNINGESYRFNDLIRKSEQRGVNTKYLSGNLYSGAARLNLKRKVQPTNVQ